MAALRKTSRTTLHRSVNRPPQAGFLTPMAALRMTGRKTIAMSSKQTSSSWVSHPHGRLKDDGQPHSLHKGSCISSLCHSLLRARNAWHAALLCQAPGLQLVSHGLSPAAHMSWQVTCDAS